MGLALEKRTTQENYRQRSENARAASERFPWERQDGESYAAFSRFVLYRNTEPGTRSMRKLGVSGTTAFRWAKRWHWTARASAYDLWQLELSDGLANHNATVHRSAVVRFGSASLAKATQAVAKLNETKLTVDDLVNLAKTGVTLERQALGMTEESTIASRAPVAQVAVSFGSAPPWLAGQAGQNETKLIEAKANEQVLVPCGEQVIARPPLIGRRTRLAERKVNCPKGKL